MLLKKRFCFSVKFLVSLVFLFSCVSQELPKDRLLVILDSKPSTLDPRRALDANGMRILSLIFNGFVHWDEEKGVKGDLAESWFLKGNTWTFYLKPDLTFSNGRPVQKEDILFSFQEFQKKSSPFYSSFKNIDSVKVSFKSQKGDFLKPDKDSSSLVKKGEALMLKKGNAPINSKNPSPRGQFVVKVSLKKFQAPFLHSDLPVIKILPKKEILQSPGEFQKHPWGTGEFRVFKNNFREILLQRKNSSEFYPLRQISFLIIRDSLTRTQKISAKEADIAPSVIPLEKISRFQRQKDSFQIQSQPGLSTTYLLLNLKNKFLKEPALRKALSFSLNREEIIKYKLGGYAVPAGSFVSPGSYFFNRELPPLAFHPESARSIVQKMGLKGIPLELSCSNNKNTIAKARVLISQINYAMGLNVSLKSSEWGAFYKDVSQGAYDMALMKWVGVTDPDIYRVAFHSENLAPQGRNRSFYKNKKLDDLLERGLRERDNVKRKKIYDKVQWMIYKDFVVIPLWHDMEISVLNKNIENYRLSPKGDFLSLPFVRKK